ncbi:nucleoside-diphosphate-sugar epimerase [Herbihabitans rhizosphaerae]|uniref:Nucleoside-diphosphate-sugar epimerase n=1 Tax=Herbihabitans rhizosphaerae TaxID=1872711 RepID=A0A4Q7KD04_9PSEU|nr:saccharopine dehydrogenase NADP-binding domain-containing protein [Herbihabitans rhizosphaerae]RZS29818.1 nucleoside-diphosphate-sugar epimerase [Herbihabitans rhizosphaerae]
MASHVIVGAGAVGSATATLLAERGEQVTIVSRSGSGPDHQNVKRVAADATDADRLSQIAEGAAVLYNCLNPEYHRWLTDWPPLAAALLTAAERSGAVYAITGNLYGYGEVDGPITDDTPLAATHPKLKLRADMWRDALAAAESGRIRAVTEVRGSDYIEANSIFTFMLDKPLRAGKRGLVPTPLDVPHSFTAIADMARTMVTVAGDERGLNKAWLVPSNEPMTIRQIAERFTEVIGAPKPKLASIPALVLSVYGLFDPFVRELRTTRYQWAKPFSLDASSTTSTFGIAPTDLDIALKAIKPVA